MARPAFSPMLRLQIASVGILVAIAAFLRFAFAEPVPRDRLLAVELLFGALIAWRIASITVIRARPGFHDDTPDGWAWNTLVTVWIVALVILASFWLTMPYQGEAERLLAVLFCQAPVAATAIGTVQPPRAARRSLARTIVPAVLPTGLIAFYLAYPGRFTLPVVMFCLFFGSLMLLLRSVVQRTATMVWIAKHQADAEREAKARFVASASHDLGQPLQSARLFFDQAMRGTDAARRAHAAAQGEAALGAVDRQLQRMNEHLRLDAGAVVARNFDIPVRPVIARVAALAAAAAARSGVAISSVGSRWHVCADDELVERALSNLVDNALRHAKARRVLIGARGKGARVRLWVIDDGVGIAAADCARLFDDYAQGRDHGDEVRGGFGLGLASVRRIAALMNGSAGIVTTPGRGAAFFLELPGGAIQR